MTIILTVLALLAVPGSAAAWGGGMHLLVGQGVLAGLGQIPPAIAAILSAHPLDFLYGCIAADIIVGKKYTHYLLNCHRWGIGRKVLHAAKTDAQRACAYGYLCHLAADTIAHNYYVPYKIMHSFAAVTMKHAYWEMRFETFVEKEVWERAREVCGADQRANDTLLRSVVAPTLFSFGTNKRIFNSIMLLSRLDRWQRVMQTLADNSRYVLEEGDREEFLTLTQKVVAEFLADPEGSQLLAADPTGERALAMAEAVRKNLRLLYGSGKLTRAEGMAQVEELRRKLVQALHDPVLLAEVYSG